MTTHLSAIDTARQLYFEAFKNEGPRPFGIDEAVVAGELLAAVARGKPLDPSYNWWAGLSEDLMA